MSLLEITNQSNKLTNENQISNFPIPLIKRKRKRRTRNETTNNPTISNKRRSPDQGNKKPRCGSSNKFPCLIVKQDEIDTFFQIFDFLCQDNCCRYSDRYLLAMVFAYFKRASLDLHEYTRENFFIALYLANDMEEDEEDYKYEIFPWALGSKWRDLFPAFLLKRDLFWKRMGFRAAVSRKICEKVIQFRPDNFIWKRERQEYHGGALRNHRKSSPEREPYPKGPGCSPIPCNNCSRGFTSSGYFSDVDIQDENSILVPNLSPPKPAPMDSLPFKESGMNNSEPKPQTSATNNDEVDRSFMMDELWEMLF